MMRDKESQQLHVRIVIVGTRCGKSLYRPCCGNQFGNYTTTTPNIICLAILNPLAFVQKISFVPMMKRGVEHCHAWRKKTLRI